VFAGDSVFVWAIGDGGFTVTSLAIGDGAPRWDHASPFVSAASRLADGLIVIPRSLGAEYLFQTRQRTMLDADGCALGERYLSLVRTPEEDAVVDMVGTTVAELDFGSVRSRASKLIGCGTYRGQTALLVERTGEPRETRLVLADASGHVTAEHVLPPVADMDRDAASGIPMHRLSFAGELPREVPLVAITGADGTPIMVDMETGKVSGNVGEHYAHLHTFRDGSDAYFSVDFGAWLYHYRPDLRAFERVTSVPVGSSGAHQVGGGYIWTFDKGTARLDAPPITATPARPRRA
jgi:hypothetical protein